MFCIIDDLAMQLSCVTFALRSPKMHCVHSTTYTLPVVIQTVYFHRSLPITKYGSTYLVYRDDTGRPALCPYIWDLHVSLSLHTRNRFFSCVILRTRLRISSLISRPQAKFSKVIQARDNKKVERQRTKQTSQLRPYMYVNQQSDTSNVRTKWPKHSLRVGILRPDSWECPFHPGAWWSHIVVVALIYWD